MISGVQDCHKMGGQIKSAVFISIDQVSTRSREIVRESELWGLDPLEDL